MDNFDKKFQKHVIKTLNKDVPNPYKKNVFLSLPLWAKISIPLSTLAVATSVAVAIIVPNTISNNSGVLSPSNEFVKPIDETNNPTQEENESESIPNEGILSACAPKNTQIIPNINSGFVNRTALKTIKNLEDYFEDQRNTNCVLSPASYLLTITGVAAVSDNFNLDVFGLEDAGEDNKTFLESLNCSFTDGDKMAQYDAGILHQQVGPTYEFVNEKRQEVADDYISTAVANLGNYDKQAEEYFKKHAGITIPIPNLNLKNDCVVTYGALYMRDKCEIFYSDYKPFYINGECTSVPAAVLGHPDNPITIPYYENEQYKLFSVKIYKSNMLIVLPKDNVSLESISISEAYTLYKNGNLIDTEVYGYIPYFHVKSDSVNLTSNVLSNFTGNELLYSKLLKNGLKSDTSHIQCLQSSNFEFSETGITAQSITAFCVDDSVEQDTDITKIKVDRPFYSITLRDDFPLFVSKVNNPLIN